MLPANLNLASFELLKNLTSLHIPFDEQTIRLLALVGTKIKELSIFPVYNERRIEEWFSGLPKVFSSCPNLEYLSLKDVSGTCDMKDQVPLAEDLKLKKFYLDGFCAEAGGLLPFLFSAPKLEEVKLGHFSASVSAVEIVISLLSVEAIFKNVTKVDLGKCYALSKKKKMLTAMENLATHIISFSPKLLKFQFNFDSLTLDRDSYEMHPDGTFAHCLAIFNEI